MPEAEEALKAVETSRGPAPSCGPGGANSRAPAETPANATSPRGEKCYVSFASAPRLSRPEAKGIFKTRLKNLSPRARTFRNYRN